MNKKATFSATVLLAMSTTAGAAITQAPARDSGLNIPLPGTIEYITASQVADDRFFGAAAKKRDKPPKKKR